ncbi:hypothetical protein MLD38_013720 [Melastoma candidum]|uniref:Uncharacterized protein n=1 Tax=Melastoma candidum TaxID=119954 RepID=A0ACB9RE63_9MYRT|nr:hypothetical protein MLD38_013720 [Melastoma candidum]
MSFQLSEADPTNASPNSHPLSLSFGSILLQRAWLQGVLVYVLHDDRLILNGGTGVIELSLSGEFTSSTGMNVRDGHQRELCPSQRRLPFDQGS